MNAMPKTFQTLKIESTDDGVGGKICTGLFL
jgi:hypothetical protein